jgi:hypothetical protein
MSLAGSAIAASDQSMTPVSSDESRDASMCSAPRSLWQKVRRSDDPTRAVLDSRETLQGAFAGRSSNVRSRVRSVHGLGQVGIERVLIVWDETLRGCGGTA